MKRGFAPLNIISNDEVEQIKEGTLNVLETTGAMVEDPEVLKMMGNAGCGIDLNEKRVRIPRDIVLQCLEDVPSSYVLKARERDDDVLITGDGENTVFMGNCGMKLLDLDTWATREPTRKEFYDAIKVFDYLKHVDIHAPFPYWGFEKVPGIMRLIESAAAKFRYSTKAQEEGSTADEYRWITAMAKLFDSDIQQLCNSASPLAFFQSFTDRLKFLTENDQPIQFAPGPSKGFTGPVTIAGCLISNNAETIVGMVMSQLFKKGARSWASNMVLTPNMSNGLPSFGDIGNQLSDAIHNQVWRSYNIPCIISCSGWTNSMKLDYQAGYELTFAGMLDALTGPSGLTYFSALNAQLSAHPIKSIIDNDVVGMIKRFCQGVLVTEETLAVDLINEIGPMPGTFLDNDHTFKWWRKETYLPEAASRLSGLRWFEGGAKDTIDLAREKLDYILANHKPKLLTDSQEEELEYILNDARQYYRKKGLINDEDWSLYQEDLNSPGYPYA
jgi:trimethylamine--corrinoid protein Co-methyltransferase